MLLRQIAFKLRSGIWPVAAQAAPIPQAPPANTNVQQAVADDDDEDIDLSGDDGATNDSDPATDDDSVLDSDSDSVTDDDDEI